MTDPCISAIVPNYNHAHFLPRCLGGMLNQSARPYEIVVVDDGSTDNSLEVLEALSREHSIIRVYRNERNLGVNATTNRAISLARGDYLFLIGADDEVRPGVFESATRMLRQYPQAGFCSGLCEYRCASTGQTWYIGANMPNQPSFLSPRDILKRAKQGRFVATAQAAVFKKSAVVEAGGYNPSLKWFADWFCAYVVGFRHGMCFLPEVRSTFNVSPTSYYNAKTNDSAERRAVMGHLLDLLESEPYQDVASSIGESGLLGVFGWSMVRVAASQRRHRRFLTTAFARHAARRSAEVVGRRFFPNWLAKACLKLFYGRGRGSENDHP